MRDLGPKEVCKAVIPPGNQPGNGGKKAVMVLIYLHAHFIISM